MKILENLKGILVAVDAANQDTVHSQVQHVVLHYNEDYPILVTNTLEEDKIKTPVLVQQNLLASYTRLPNSHLIFVLILPIQNEEDIVLPQQRVLHEILDSIQFQIKNWVQKLETLENTTVIKLNEIFGHFFNIYFFKSSSLQHALFLFHETPHSLKLPLETNLMVSEELTNFEASSNSSNEEFHNCPRPSFILGTCLFYHGSIVLSHLSEKVTKQVSK